MIGAISALLPFMLVTALAQNVPNSPCPNVFTYEANGTEPGIWYGLINISSDSTLYSLFLNIVLDNKAELLGNWIGPVKTTDNTEFNIENMKMKITPGTTTPFRFFIKHKVENKTPRLQVIRLNGREICNADIPIPGPVLLPKPIEKSNPPPPKSPDQDTKPIIPITPADIFETTTKPNNPNKGDSNRVDLIPTPLLEQIFNAKPDVLKLQEKPMNTPNFLPLPAPPSFFNQNKNEKPVYGDFSLGPKPIRLPDSNSLENVCGTVTLNANPLVLKGKLTLEGQWPWHASLYRAKGTDNNYICGGTLVSTKYVITAAHCVTVYTSNVKVDPSILTVHLGKYSLRSNKGLQIALVNDVIVHPEYNGNTYSRDLGVLDLSEPVTFTDWVRPACLWPENMVDLNNVVYKEGAVVGWELDDAGLATDALRLVGMLIVDQETCLRSHYNFFGRYTSNYTYCAGYRNGSSACNGDSGGGMVLNYQNRWYLRGLVSLSVATPSGACDPNYFIVFTDLAKFLPWLKSVLLNSQSSIF